METRLNRIIAWLDDPSGDVTEDIRILDAYYRSPLWRSDFEADEAGKLPADLPRGVLSEDGIYNVLEKNKGIISASAEIIYRTWAASEGKPSGVK